VEVEIEQSEDILTGMNVLTMVLLEAEEAEVEGVVVSCDCAK